MKYVLVIFIIIASVRSGAQNQGLDPSFGNNGIVNPLEIVPGWWAGVALQSDQRIVLFGGGGVRYENNGSKDNSFNSIPPVGWNTLIQPDDKILVAANYWWQSNEYSVLRRFNADGVIDSTFGSNGVDSFFKLNLDISTSALLLQPDNKIILIANTTSDLIYLTRLLSNGLVDSSFGTNGEVMDFAAPNTYSYEASGAALQSDGKIVVGITESTNQYFYTAIRFLPSGERDTTYGDHGFARFPGLHRVNAVNIQSDGKLLLAGTHFGAPQSDTAGVPFQLVRFDTAGHIDTSFNHTGLGLYTWGGGTANKCRTMAVQPDGKVILGGRVWNEAKQDYDFGLLRVLPDGKLDNGFGEHGKLRTRVRNKMDDMNSIVLQNDGKILAVGESECNENDNCNKRIMLRYLPDGKTGITEMSLNASFIVYPNPVNDKVFLLSKGSPTAVGITLTDMVGRVLLTRNCVLGLQEIGLSNLKAGIYILCIADSNNKSERFKIVKQ